MKNVRGFNSRTKIIAVIFFAILMLLFVGCGAESSTGNIVDFTPEQVQKIHIEFSPRIFPAYDVVDEDDIAKVVDYLNGLHPVTTKKDMNEYSGGGYLLTFTLTDDTERLVVLFGNMFLKIGDKVWELPYGEASGFDKISGGFLLDSFDENGFNTVTGRVRSVVSETSGHNLSCEITDSDHVYKVDIADSIIIDITGNGWLILHEGDRISVKYTGNDEAIVAEAVFILESNSTSATSGLDGNGGFLPLEDLPDVYTKEQARTDGVVVDDAPHYPSASAQLPWVLFRQAASEGKPATVRTMRFTEDGTQIIMDIGFDGHVYDYKKVEIAGNGEGGSREYSEGQCRYLTGYVDKFSATEYIVLANDDEVTDMDWKDADGFDGEFVWIFRNIEVERTPRQ
jgi:hypothetical protein